MSEHPFRPLAVRPLCTVCRERTAATCALCKQPYCPEHLDYGWRCPGCAPRVRAGYRSFLLTFAGVLALLILLLAFAAVLLPCL